ncbi:chorismate mutase [Streptosporangium sp. 'caverna']|uniref:chorismate mutase n=1 Tax=Streptosporangium sp. 'caverna' TaxID=2202249 RepID=UPI000D7E6469|nr:chorismate mutase [Streptosporangium sp. 'caverna']AWS46531.1 chorismate mutase [Streptosporangium sp. 'caverna']
MSADLPISRSTAIVSMVTALVLGGSSVAFAAPSAPVVTPGQTAEGIRQTASLVPLTDLAVQRILLADKVAAAKFGTGRPIDDPVREQQVLDQVTTLSTGMGLDPADGTRFFRDQIDAGKVVQHGLYALWGTRPKLRPADRPDLTTEVRPQLDKITTEILEQLKATADVRGANHACDVQLSGAAASAAQHRHLDRLHRDALNVALRSVCTAPPRPTNGTG